MIDGVPNIIAPATQLVFLRILVAPPDGLTLIVASVAGTRTAMIEQEI